MLHRVRRVDPDQVERRCDHLPGRCAERETRVAQFLPRLQSDRERDDYREIVLDAAKGTPTVMGRSSYVRGSELHAAEQRIGETSA